MATNDSAFRILRRKDVENRTGLSRSSIYLRMQRGTFPSQIKLGTRAVGWLEQEIEAWLEARVSERNARQEVAP